MKDKEHNQYGLLTSQPPSINMVDDRELQHQRQPLNPK